MWDITCEEVYRAEALAEEARRECEEYEEAMEGMLEWAEHLDLPLPMPEDFE